MNVATLLVAAMVGVAYVALGALTYNRCLDRYGDKFPGWSLRDATAPLVPLARKTCFTLAVAPITGLPILEMNR